MINNQLERKITFLIVYILKPTQKIKRTLHSIKKIFHPQNIKKVQEKDNNKNILKNLANSKSQNQKKEKKKNEKTKRIRKRKLIMKN